jgi:hypothetical protein
MLKRRKKMSMFAVQELKELLDSSSITKAGNLRFVALVKYHYRNKTDIEKLTVNIELNGYNGNSISIDDGNEINSNKHHMQFTPDFQEYVCDGENKVFIINGDSPKMNGKYTVELHFE